MILKEKINVILKIISVEKKGIKFRIKDILLLNVFFNPLQKYFIKYMVYTLKEKILKRLMFLDI